MLKSHQPAPAMRGFGGNTQFRPNPLPLATAAGPEPGGGITPTVALFGFFSLTLIVPIAELLIIYLHAHIPVVVIADAILTILLLTTGRVTAFMRVDGAKLWMALLVLFGAAALFGIYPGRSAPFILTYAYRFHLFPFYACALAVSTKQVRHAISWIGWGSFVIMLLALKFGEMLDGRLAIPDTDFSNPNDLGLGILLAMSGLIVFRSKFSRALAVLGLPVFVMLILRTGSRACLVTVVALIVMLLMLLPSRTRVLMMILIPVGGAIIMTAVPSTTLSRMTLIVADTSGPRSVDDLQLSNAIDSQAARTELQKRAFNLALRNPLLGVGAMNLEDAIDDMIRKATGKKSGWQGAHNTYLEIAGEDGFPAAIIYVIVMLTMVRLNYRSYRTCRNVKQLMPASAQCLSLLMMTMAFALCTVFNNDAYSPTLCMMLGLSAANFLAVQREAKAYVREAEGAAVPTVRQQFKAQQVRRYPAPALARPQWGA
jgi:O-antigen ligase